MRYYRKKPDLRQLYLEKEEQRILRMSEIEECGRIIRRVLEELNRAIIENPSDLWRISQVAKDCMEQLRKKLKERDFKGISKFDVDRILRSQLEMIRPKNCS